LLVHERVSGNSSTGVVVKWNYRVLRRRIGSHETCSVHEVYYDNNGHISSWTENPIIPAGETPEELKEDFFRQLQAFEHPFLDYDVLDRTKREKG